ncbi:MAG: aminotransferase class IV [Candidatus Poseidoniaceae archaeon]|nr:aminotransferase class IV [Candidatus Poseidoniaceae archaeon]
MEGDPFSSVFTTMPCDEYGRIAFLDAHLNRLKSHAERLNIDIPNDFHDLVTIAIGELQGSTNHSTMLSNLATLRLTREGDVSIKLRVNEKHVSPMKAISVPDLQWADDIKGTKHGDWAPYKKARQKAIEVGAHIALFVEDEAVTDADRATPILLDNDGTAWIADARNGGVDSVTASLIIPALEKAGIPINKGRLHQSLIGRAKEFIVVGSGIGVVRINDIDGHAIGMNGDGILTKTAVKALEKALGEYWAEGDG